NIQTVRAAITEKIIHSSYEIPNPFEKRQFAFNVLSEEKNPMSRAHKCTHIMPTLAARMQQLLTTQLWESIMLGISLWTFIPLLVVNIMPNPFPSLKTFFELSMEVPRASLFIEICCKFIAGSRWFFYDIWNLFDLMCVILNSPFLFTFLLPKQFSYPQMNSILRLFRILHAVRLIRVHRLLRFVFETTMVAIGSITNTLLLETVTVTVFGLLSVAFRNDTPFWDKAKQSEAFANYTQAVYSYYMCITMEGVNEVASEILLFDTPSNTTIIGLLFYCFAALCTYAIAVIATTLDKAMEQWVKNTKQKQKTNNLIELQSTNYQHRSIVAARCNPFDESLNFSKLKPDDLSLLCILFQSINSNLNEYDNILEDIKRIGEYIAKYNKKKLIIDPLQDNQILLQRRRLETIISTLAKVMRNVKTGDLLSALGEFLLIDTRKHVRRTDIETKLKAVEQKFAKVRTLLSKLPVGLEQQERDLIMANRLKRKIYRKTKD
ncbi:unnamed protein product, partial [Didymodactylos carnosus]